MPACLVRGLRSIELVATNLDEATRFYETVWGLAPVERRNDAQYFRGTGGYHHILGLHRGAQPAVVRIVFDVADRQAVEALHKAVTAAGCSATAPGPVALPGGGYGFGCKDLTGATLSSSAAAPIMPTPRTSPTGRARSCTPISTCATTTRVLRSSPRRSASVWSTKTRR